MVEVVLSARENETFEFVFYSELRRLEFFFIYSCFSIHGKDLNLKIHKEIL